MIFAAGLGARLRPLTNDRPKALVEIGGHPLLYWAIHRLRSAGYTSLVINIHHFGELMLAYLDSQDWGVEILISDEREQVLETGGGLKKAKELLRSDSPILVHNVDVLSEVDLAAMRQRHEQSQALATLAMKDRPSSRNLLFDANQQLCAWRHNRTGELRMAREPKGELTALAFSGIHLIEPRMLDLLTEVGKFSIIDSYLRLATSERIQAYQHDEQWWLDVGKPEALPVAEEWVKGER